MTSNAQTEARLPRDLVTILRTEAKNQRTPPIDYAIASDGGRMVVHPEPDIAMAELLEEAAERIAALEAAWIIKDPIEGDIRDYHEGVVKSLMDTINHLKNQLTAKDAELAEVKADRDRFKAKKISLQDDALPRWIARAERAEAALAEARKALEWHPIETAPLNTIVDLWCTYADAPASWGNDRPAGEIVHNRHKSKEHGWFGNESNDGIPQANGPDLVPVAWRWPAPEIPLEMMERFVAARAREAQGGE